MCTYVLWGDTHMIVQSIVEKILFMRQILPILKIRMELTILCTMITNLF